jgi:signal transduction histidine kinase
MLDPVPEPTQVAAYYVVSEAFTNAAKHGHATSCGCGRSATTG